MEQEIEGSVDEGFEIEPFVWVVAAGLVVMVPNNTAAAAAGSTGRSVRSATESRRAFVGGQKVRDCIAVLTRVVPSSELVLSVTMSVGGGIRRLPERATATQSQRVTFGARPKTEEPDAE